MNTNLNWCHMAGM